MHVTQIQVKRRKFRRITGNSSETNHYPLQNFQFCDQFSHYNMPAFTRTPVSAYTKARLCEAYTNGEDFVDVISENLLYTLKQINDDCRKNLKSA